MIPTLVQEAVANTTANHTHLDVTFTAAATAGNTLILAVGTPYNTDDLSSPFVVTDDGGNTWKMVNSSTSAVELPLGTPRVDWFTVLNIGVTNTVTFTCTTSQSITLHLSEWEGNLSAFDVDSIPARNRAGDGSDPAIRSGSLSTAAPLLLLAASSYPISGGSSTAGLIAVDGSAATQATSAVASGSGAVRLEPLYSFATPTDTFDYTGAWTQSSAALAGASIIAFASDFSSAGQYDVLGGDFGSTSFDDITADVMSMSAFRGRRGINDTPQAGTLTLNLADPEQRYNPQNTGSDLAGLLAPLRAVRAYASQAGTAYPVAFAFTSIIRGSQAKNTPYAQIDSIDLLEKLSRSYPVIADAGLVTADAAIATLLDAVGYSDPTYRDLAPDETIQNFTSDGTTSALDLLNQVLTATRGSFFFDADGTATYRSRRSSLLAPPVAAFDTAVDQQPGLDGTQIINSVTITDGNSGILATYTDTTSATQYGTRATTIDSALISSIASAESTARYVVNAAKDPATPVWNLVVSTGQSDPDQDQWTRVLQVDIGDVITGPSGDNYEVIGIQHDVTPPALHVATYVLAPVGAAGDITQPFVIGHSNLNSADQITF